MAVLEIKIYPDKVLRKRCKQVESVDNEIKRLLEDMSMTMHAANGIGLAAPQVGLDMHLLVADIGEGIIKIVNPKIMARQGVSVMEEGCLSMPGICVKVKRSAKVSVSGLDITGKHQLIDARGLLAHVLQHEIDHLDGRLLIDYVPLYRRPFVKSRLTCKAL